MATTAIAPIPNSNCLNRLKTSAKNSFFGKTYTKISPYFPIIPAAIKAIINANKAQIFQTFLNFITSTTSATGSSWERYAGLKELVKYSKILSIVAAPFALKNIAQNIYYIVLGIDRKTSALKLADNISWLSGSIGTFMRGLEMAGKLSEKTISVIPFLSVGSLVLSTASIALHWSKRSQVKKLFNDLRTKSDLGVLQHVTQTHTDAGLKDLFGVNGKKLRGQLQQMIATNDSTLHMQAKDLLHSRLKVKQLSHEILLVVSVITTIATIILLKNSGSLVSYGMLAGSSAILIGRFFYERKATSNFRRRMALLIPPQVPPQQLSILAGQNGQ